MFRFVAWPFALMNMAASFLGFDPQRLRHERALHRTHEPGKRQNSSDLRLTLFHGCGMSGLYTGLMSRASAKTPQISG
jgi:hypothetical protein